MHVTQETLAELSGVGLRTIKQFESGKVSAPIALKLENDDLYLVAGNTRLMMCKARKVQPSIVIVNTDW